MKLASLKILLIIAAFGPSVPLYALDAKHVTAAAAVTTACTGLFNGVLRANDKYPMRIGCAVMVLATGLAFEAMDANQGSLNREDLASNALGVAAGFGLSVAFDF